MIDQQKSSINFDSVSRALVIKVQIPGEVCTRKEIEKLIGGQRSANLALLCDLYGNVSDIFKNSDVFIYIEDHDENQLIGLLTAQFSKSQRIKLHDKPRTIEETGFLVVNEVLAVGEDVIHWLIDGLTYIIEKLDGVRPSLNMNRETIKRLDTIHLVKIAHINGRSALAPIVSEVLRLG
ncbi:MAG: hypothetical protein U9N57_01405 [Pseudomonadota bacterium]|nr:hypothetical protein [Pseudomonadota bacterium]